MKAINFKLATFSFAALLLASCSDNGNDINSSGNTERNTTVIGSAVTSITDAQQLAARVHNYKFSTTSTKTRTIDTSNSSKFEGVREMPAEPTVPNNAQAVTAGTSHQKGNYYVDKDIKYDNNTTFAAGSCIYIKKGATFEMGQWSSDITVYVLEGGTMVDTNQTSGKLYTIYNYGTLKFNNDEVIIGSSGGKLYSAKDLDLTGKTFNVQGKCYIGGNLKCQTLSNTGMKLNVKGDCEITGTGEFRLNGDQYTPSNNSYMNVDGKFKCNGYMTMNSGAEFYSGCSVDINGNLDVNSGAKMSIGYLKASNITLSSGSSIILKDQSMIDCSGTLVSNNQDNAKNYLEGDNAVAVIKAGTITFNNGAPVGNTDNKKYEVFMFATPGANSKIVVQGGTFKLNDTEIIPEFKDANVFLSSDTDNASNVVIKKTECNPDGWNDDKKKDDDDKKDDKTPGNLDKITVIDYDNHDHDISATGIMELGNKMYMSYHTRGDVSATSTTGHGGCVEVFTPVTDNQVTMNQYLYDEAQDLDFNHLLAVQHDGKKKIYMPGSSYKKGAMLAYMDILDNGLLNTESTAITSSETGEDGKTTVTYNQPLQYIQMNPATSEFKGYDENCVVYNEQTKHLIVMTTKGYIVYDLDYNEVARYAPTKGKAKHVAIGDGKIVTLVLDDEATTTDEAINAHVYIYDAATENWENPTASFTVNTIQPNNGKNVIAINDNKIYVCRGAAGMYVYDMNGTEQWHYQMPNAQIENEESEKNGQYKALANGLFVDDNYVYVAYGSHGLVVLDKSGNVIARRAESKSANYVYVHDGYIYVAYGKDRLQVFKLYPNGIDGTDTDYNNND